jgi:hypothetical protein
VKDVQLMAGFARVDITPPLGEPIVGYFEERVAKGVLDNLEVNAVAFDDSERRAVLITADLLGIEGAAFNAALRRRIARAAGIDEAAVYIHCTHTHTGPGAGKADKGRTDLFDGTEFFNEFLAARLADAARLAIVDLSPATLAVGCAQARRISFLRRYRMKDGSIRTNPGVGNPEIDSPLGMLDETVRVLKIAREGKDDIALVNFATHPDTIGGELISGDWPAMARRTFELAEPGSRCVVLNGPQGDVNHVCTDPLPGENEGLFPQFDGVARGYDHARHMGRVVASAALSVWGKCAPVAAGKLRYAVKMLSVPSQMPSPSELSSARRIVRLHRAGRDSELPFKDMELTTAVAEAGRMLLLEHGPKSFKLPLSALAIGDSIIFAGIPGEPFSEIGFAVRSQSPFANVFCTCLTNSSQGYFPVASAYAEGGYEARSSIFGPSVADDIVTGLLNLMRILLGTAPKSLPQNEMVR